MNTYAIVLNHCSFLITASNNHDIMDIADAVEKLCDKNILADEPVEVINLTQGTRFDGLLQQNKPESDGFVAFSKITDDDDEIENIQPTKEGYYKDQAVYLQHPIFPTINNNFLTGIEQVLKQTCPVCKNPHTRGRYTPYIKK